MGLDLIVRKQHDIKIDEKGRTTFQVTVLANLRNCWNILEKLGDRLENNFDNCATYSFSEGTLHAILKELEKKTQKMKTQKMDLEYEIEKLKEFFKEYNLTPQEDAEDEYYGDTYEIHAWW